MQRKGSSTTTSNTSTTAPSNKKQSSIGAAQPAAAGTTKKAAGPQNASSTGNLSLQNVTNQVAENKAYLQDIPNVVTLLNSLGGERYEGQADAQSRRHGQGVLTWPNGNCYRGSWNAGSMSGQGIFLYGVEGDKYEGKFLDDKKHGAGVYTFANGNMYQGEFKWDKRHGQGKYSWMCGDMYDGEWQEGKMHGRGVTTYSNGNVYSGMFVEDRREGKGSLTCTDGLTFDGEWLNNMRHGQGTIVFPSGDKYIGEWQNDKKHGQGHDTFANGNHYEGQFKNNARCGNGTMKYGNGDVYVGEWQEDKMHGKGRYIFNNGFVYDGDWRADCRHGYGVYVFPSQHRYEGEWREDKRSGKGVLTLQTGDKYVGSWVGGKMEGEFRVIIGDVDVYKGGWKGGAPHGKGTFHLPSGLFHGEWDFKGDAKKMEGTITVPADIPSLVHDVSCGDDHLRELSRSVLELHAAQILQAKKSETAGHLSTIHNLEVKLSRLQEHNTALLLLEEAFKHSQKENEKLKESSLNVFEAAGQAKALEASIASLRQQLDVAEKDRMTLESSLKDAQNKILSVGSALKAAESHIKELEKNAVVGSQAENQRVKVLETQLEASNVALAKTEGRLTSQGDEYRKLIAESQQEIKTLHEAIQSLTAKHRDALLKGNESELQRDSARREIAELRANTTSMEGQLTALATRELKLKDALAAIHEKARITSDGLTDTQIQCDLMQAMPEELKAANHGPLLKELEGRITELNDERRQDKSTIRQLEADLAAEKKKRKKAEKIFTEDGEISGQAEMLRNQLVHTRALLEKAEKDLAVSQQLMQTNNKNYASLQQEIKEVQKSQLGRSNENGNDWRVKYLQQQVDERDKTIEDNRLELARVKQLESKLLAAEHTIQTLTVSAEMHGRIGNNRANADFLKTSTQNAIVQERRMQEERERKEVQDMQRNGVAGRLRASSNNFSASFRNGL